MERSAEEASVPARPGASLELLPVLSRQPGHLLWRAHARVLLALGEVLPAGVDLTGFAVLVTLDDDRPRSQQELAGLLSTSRTTLARVAADLTGRGLVARVRNPEDRRSYALTRTPDGARAAGLWTDHVAALEDRLTAGFSPAERAELAGLLTDLLLAADDADQVVVPTALRESLAFLANRVHHRLHRDFLEALAPVDLEPRLFAALTALEATGPITQAELARALGTSGASMVAMTDALEHRGLVVRRRDPADRRTHLLHLTEVASRTVEQARALAATSLTPWFAPLGPDRLRRLVRLLQRFVTDP